jgi:phosphatidate phosphatase APP1
MGLFKRDPWKIIAFQTYGTNTHLYARGRAIEDEAIDLSKKGIFSLMLNNYKRFGTDEVKHTPLVLMLPDGRSFQTTTDHKGYFIIDRQVENLEQLADEEGFVHYEIAFANPPASTLIKSDNRFLGEIIIPCSEAEFGIASDIDDTILHTGVTSRFKWRLIINTMFKRAGGRSPLEGAAEFCHMLHRGSTGKLANPMFYVSHSPWNLYRYLELFLTKNGFPKGPILLRNLSDFFSKKIGEKPQKHKDIIQLLEMYPNLPFILIGDSGENDADIYIEIAETFPKRIKAIYLRSVQHEKRMLRIRGLIDNYKTTPALLVESSEQAIEHAKLHGFIA